MSAPPVTGTLLERWGPQEEWVLPIQLQRQAMKLGDRPFLQVRDGRAESFAELYESARATAARLLTLGIAPGETVLTMAPTGLEAIHAWLGANVLGAIDVPLNTAWRRQPLVHAINVSRARVMLIDRCFLDRLCEVEEDLTSLEVVATLGEGPPSAAPQRLRTVHFPDVAADAALPSSGPRFRDLASVVFTSGTSGPAKGVLLAHAQAYASARESLEGLRITADDVFYCFHPLFHVGPKFYATYAALIAGARVVLDTEFEPTTLIDRLRRFGGTLTIGHGPMLEQIYAQPERPDDADNPLRAFMAAPLPKAIAVDFERRFATRGIEVYGMTEITTTMWRPYDEELRVGSCGPPLDEIFEVRIVDQDDRELPRGEVGEITVRAKLPWVLMQGYLGDPAATLETTRNQWLHTGDDAYMDADGWVYYMDRAKDRIRRRAENISSYDIEAGAGHHPQVLECAAVGVPSEYEADDDIKLCVVADGELDPLSLLEHLVADLPHHMVPRYIEFLPEMPRTPTNKIRKQLLRDLGVTDATWDRKAANVSIREIANAQQAQRASSKGPQ